MRLTISYVLSTFQTSKAKKINCYMYLLIWIILFTTILYWFLTNNSSGSSSSFNNNYSITTYYYFLQNLNQTKFQKLLKPPPAASINDDERIYKNTFIKKPNDVNNNVVGIIFDDDVKDTDKSSNDNNVNNNEVQELLISNPNFKLDNINDDLFDNSNSNSNTRPRIRTDIDDDKEFVLVTNPQRLCNSPEKIQTEDENWEHPDYKLEAIIILIRHGDRGPLTHVGHHNITNINCQGKIGRRNQNHKLQENDDHPDHLDLKNLLKFSESMSKQPGYSTFIGPFHSFPKTPASPNCQLGQLSQLGSTQLIHLGKLIRSTYSSSIFNQVSLNKNLGKIISYSTRYRRTLQSLISFLYGLLGPKYITSNVIVRESQSITFCFNDCSCKLVERLKKMSSKNYQAIPEDKLEMKTLVNKLNSILGITRNKRTGASLLDLLLIYSCHNVSLPCHHKASPKSKSKKHVYFTESSSKNNDCISTKDVSALINLIQKESSGLKLISTNYHFSLLSAYGLIKEIVNLALKMTSSASSNSFKDQRSTSNFLLNNNSNRLAIFSGHDTTLQAILGALGITTSHPDLRLPPYASRFIFEFYRKTKLTSPEDHVRQFYFRAIYNGVSVTHLISFCTPQNVKKFNNEFNEADETSQQLKQYFCPLENLVRFLHDHYFDSFGNNTTNFRDACQY